MSRAALAAMTNREIDLPDLSREGASLISQLFEIGPYTAGGETALSWVDIDAFARLHGIDFSAWQVDTFRRLALHYVAGLREFSADDAPKPWISDTDDQKRAKVAAHVRNVLRAK